jgi:hypothetical protein
LKQKRNKLSTINLVTKKLIMTQIQNFKSAGIRLILIAFLCVSVSAVYAKPPLFEINPIYTKIELIKPGLSKQEVRSILDKPYKSTFYTNDKQEFVEELYYKSVYLNYERFFITYRIILVNDKVTALLQEENLYKDQKIEVVKKE